MNVDFSVSTIDLIMTEMCVRPYEHFQCESTFMFSFLFVGENFNMKEWWQE